ncbi:MAG: hypothetical protein ACYC4Q_03835 [Victivallaceae bacterium]
MKSEIIKNLQDRWAKSDGKLTPEELEQLKESRQTQRKENKAFNNI